MMTAAAADLFSLAAAGLAALAGSPPLWEGGSWPAAVERLAAFAARWGGPAEACGWSRLQLYGVHPGAPGARLDGLGAAVLVARRGDHVLGIDPGAILIATRSGARLRIYKRPPDAEAVLAWQLAQTSGKRPAIASGNEHYRK